MDVINAIESRRSIRKFKPDPISEDMIIKILQAGINAPSGGNRQPWEFIVVREDKRSEMIEVMKRGIENSKARLGHVGSAENSLRIMSQAPVTIFVFNPYGTSPLIEKTIEQQFREIVDVQSIGAAIQNMLLAATELGIGSLWICDVFYAYEELCQWLNKKSQMVAAISLGYADEQPPKRPRKGIDEVVEWR